MEFVSESPSKETSLKTIDKELNKIVAQANAGESFDEARMDELVQLRASHPEFLAKAAEEKASFLSENAYYLDLCLRVMRSFVPPDIHATDEATLREKYGFSAELARRLKNKACLWMIRMVDSDIAKLHESDLFARYVVQGQGLDLVELSAIYRSVPEDFMNDTKGLKAEWRASIESNLFQLLKDRKQDRLAPGKQRHPAYNNFPDEGPVSDLMSMRNLAPVAASNPYKPRRSFIEVCEAHSILSKSNRRGSTEKIDQKEDADATEADKSVEET